MSDKASSNHLLGSTARWTAGVRARESLREDRLFNDPWAAALAGAEGQEWAEHRSGDDGTSIAIRTRFFDDFLLHGRGNWSKRWQIPASRGLALWMIQRRFWPRAAGRPR